MTTNLNQPEEFHRALTEGAWLLRQNRPAEAMDRLLPLYEMAPTNADVAINLGGAYILQGKWNKAVDVLSKAAELHPDNAMLWINLGAAHLGHLKLAGPKQQLRAIRAYERALEIDPKAPNVHYHLGLIYKDRREFDQAVRCFENALTINPGDADAQYWLDWLAKRAIADADAAVLSAADSSAADAQADDRQTAQDGEGQIEMPAADDQGDSN
jgi:tetratricopeptide (TPR) repeat protein